MGRKIDGSTFNAAERPFQTGWCDDDHEGIAAPAKAETRLAVFEARTLKDKPS